MARTEAEGHHAEPEWEVAASPPPRGHLPPFDDLRAIPPAPIWDRIVARSVHGERLTLSIVELDPGAVVAEHSHDHEQLGMVIRGQMDFGIGGERRALGPGETWNIPSNTPHEATAGPEGAVVIDVFAPVRVDFRDIEPLEPSAPRWPGD